MPEFRFDHVAIAVHSVKAALPLFRDVLGGEYLMGGDVAGIWRWFQLSYPDGRKIELLEPLGDGFLADFLSKRGEGLHHITFKTDDIDAAIEKVQSHGYELVDIRLDNARWKEAFLRPKSAHGTLIQIAQSATDEETLRAWTPPSIDELLD